MNTDELNSQDLFNKIRSRFSNLEIGDSKGKLTVDPLKARFFDFDFMVNNEKIGRVSISINEPGSLKIYYGSGILKDQPPEICEIWYDFLKDMRYFSKKRVLRYDTRDIERSNLKKNDYKFLSQNPVSESAMNGNKKISYRQLGETSLIITHSKPIDPTIPGSRSRNISKIMIENQDGERFIFPYPYLVGACSMQRHIVNGGNPYDLYGKTIINMSETISKIYKFKRKVGNNKDVSEESKRIMDAVNHKLDNLRETIKKLCNQKFYETWKNGFYENTPELIIDDVTSQLYKEAFTRTHFPEELVEYFPLINNIMKETSILNLKEYSVDKIENRPTDPFSSKSTIKEMEEYLNWANSLEKLKLPPDVIKDLKQLLDSKIKVGVDGTNAIQTLNGIGIYDDDLEDMIRSAGSAGDLNTILTIWLSENGYDDVISQLDLKNPNMDKVKLQSEEEPPEPEEELPEPEEELPEPEEELPEPEEELPEPEEELPEPDINLKEDIIRLSGLK